MNAGFCLSPRCSVNYGPPSIYGGIYEVCQTAGGIVLWQHISNTALWTCLRVMFTNPLEAWFTFLFSSWERRKDSLKQQLYWQSSRLDSKRYLFEFFFAKLAEKNGFQWTLIKEITEEDVLMDNCNHTEEREFLSGMCLVFCWQIWHVLSINVGTGWQQKLQTDGFGWKISKPHYLSLWPASLIS